MGNNSNTLLPTPQKNLQQVQDGVHKLTFTNEEMTRYFEDLQFALVGKFSFGYPEMNEIIKMFRGFKIKGTFTIGVLNSKRIPIQLDNENDYLKIWEKSTIWFNKFPVRVLKF